MGTTRTVCKWCGGALTKKQPHGSKREFCCANHRRYFHSYNWLTRKKKEFSAGQ